jgi:SAM-dependent methyltransferase
MANLASIVSRALPPEPWSEGEKIPWDDPAFSERMLAEHLSQAHDAASRRLETIDAQVNWIHRELLAGQPSRVLDLGCGPGLYASRLARLGHAVHGIDFSPASIRHARDEAEREGFAVDYELGDIREAEFGGPYDLVMLIFGELNVFRRDEVQSMLGRARKALSPDGRLLLEPHTFEAIRDIGGAAPTWSSQERGLWSDRAHLVLQEAFWNEDHSVAIHRWFVVDAASAAVTRYADAMQAYTDSDYRALIEGCGFHHITLQAGWPAVPAHEGMLVAYTATG